jgi:TPP-dependent pyruvate/acetoin dehydrogenase alpha subunit
MKITDLSIIKKIIWLRLAQIIVNSRYKNGDFKVPIHLALGHESIAAAVDSVMEKEDALLLTHRNIHYNLIRMGTLKEELDEYYLRESGLAGGHLGSMNLRNPDKNIVYSSSILGNNLGVGCGFALGNKVTNPNSVVFIQTGDGGIEEGSFYESLLFLKSNNLPCIIIVENNDWSLGTQIHERRAKINLAKMTDSLEIDYLFLEGNDPFEYKDSLHNTRIKAIKNNQPILVEVKLSTLGYWNLKNEDYPDGKHINYHAGPAPEVLEVCKKVYPLIVSGNTDPLFTLQKYLPLEQLVEISDDFIIQLQREIS